LTKKRKRAKAPPSDELEEDFLGFEDNAAIDKQLKDIDRLEVERIDEKKQKLKDSDEQKVAESVLDVETRTTLFKMRQKNVFETMTGVISTGKEANVYHAYTADGSEVAIKVYRTSTNIFKGLQMYILGDPRFAKIKRDQRSFVYAWAKKEFKNLSRAYKASVSVPIPVICVKDVVVMEFIGKNGIPYPLLKDELIRKAEKVYKEVLENIKKLYHKARLVHADLSEYNIIYTPKIYFIDISQAVLLEHPLSLTFLYRDIKNVNHFFQALDVPIIENDAFFEEIVGEPPSPRIKSFIIK